MPVLPNRLAEFAQIQNGLSQAELLKLFESLARVNEQLKVTRRRPVPGKTISREIGGKKGKMPVADAVEYEKKRFADKGEKEKKIDELLGLESGTLIVRPPIGDSIYPRRLAPDDIVRYTSTAGEKLLALDLERARPQRIFSPREETVLDVMLLIKKNEAMRVAKRIAERQRMGVFNKTAEELEAEYAEWLRVLRGDPPPETEEETAARLVKEEEERIAEEERLAEEAAKNFGKLENVFTLVDDAAALVAENPEAAAAVVRQWIGEAVLLDGNKQTNSEE
ncbi:MAG: hypothetical protein LBT89_07130 [Planctomycetaceae bacterium]|nr:hypothetical protein [Planctomycetaceae bacterium]